MPIIMMKHFTFFSFILYNPTIIVILILQKKKTGLSLPSSGRAQRQPVSGTVNTKALSHQTITCL